MSMVNVVFAIAGTATFLFWLTAGGVGTFVWLRSPGPKVRLARAADALTLIGMILALASWAGYAASSWPAWAPARAVHASALAVAALAVQVILVRPRGEGLAGLLIYGFSIAVQGYAVSTMWWGGSTSQSAAVLPVWAVGRDLAAIAGDGALMAWLASAAAGYLVQRAGKRQPREADIGDAGLPVLEDVTVRVALAALTVSLTLDIARAWYGWGEEMRGGLPWLLIAWLLLAASVSGLMPGAASRRVVAVFTLLSFVAVFVAVAGAT